MAKGNAVLKITGIFIVLFGIMNILFAMMYGFVGAMGFEEMGKSTLTGLLIFYGLYGVLIGFFQIGTGAMAIRQSNKEEHWLRCVIWGVVVLILGIFCTILLYATAGMIHRDSSYYPQWFSFAIVIVGGIVLPVFLIIGGILNKITYNNGYKPATRAEHHMNQAARIKAVQVDEEGENPLEADVLKEPEAKAPPERSVKGSLLSGQEGAEDNKKPGETRPGGRLAYLKSRRLRRIVDPRTVRKFARR